MVLIILENKRWKIHAWKISFREAGGETRAVLEKCYKLTQQCWQWRHSGWTQRYSTFFSFSFLRSSSLSELHPHFHIQIQREEHNNITAFNKHNNSTRERWDVPARCLFFSPSLSPPTRKQQRARILKWKNDSKSINFPYNNQAIYFHIHLALSCCLTRAACLHYTSCVCSVRSESFISSVCAVIAKERHHRYSSFKSLKMPFIFLRRRHRQNVQDAFAFFFVKRLWNFSVDGWKI